MARIVLASNNPGKVREVSAALLAHNLEIVAQSAFAVPEVAESGLTFVENALLKARNAARHSGLPALADDSGLCVDALHGAPGIHSARYAGADSNDQRNIQRLLQELGTLPAEQRTARFHCTLVLLRHAADPEPLICSAYWEGMITFEAYGSGGFGYDPVFLVVEEGQTAAELDLAVKNRLSHRGQALQALAQALAANPMFLGAYSQAAT